MKVQEVMTTALDTCERTDSIQQVADRMKKDDIGVLPVVENGRVVGMVTDRDLAIRAVAENKHGKIEEVMTHNVISVSPSTSLEEAASVMANEQVRRLPVIEQDEIVGMISLGDLAVEPMANERAGEALRDISKP